MEVRFFLSLFSFVYFYIVRCRMIEAVRAAHYPEGWWWSEDRAKYNQQTPNSSPITIHMTKPEVSEASMIGDRYTPRCRNSRLSYPAQVNDHFTRLSPNELYRKSNLNITCAHGAPSDSEFLLMKKLQNRLNDEALAVQKSRLGASFNQILSHDDRWLEFKHYKQCLDKGLIHKLLK